MTLFIGYSGNVWQAAYAALAYYNFQVATATDPASLVSVSEATLETLLNGVDCINANDMAASWMAEASALQQIEALPLVIDPGSVSALQNRIAAYVSAASALGVIVPPISSFIDPVMKIAGGNPAIPDMGLLQFYENFSYETPPSGLSASNLATSAAGISSSFMTIANAILFFQGQNLTQLYDVATRESLAAGTAAYIDQSFTSGGFSSGIPLVSSWNQMASLPAMAMSSYILSSSPALQANQQSGCIRYAMLRLAAIIENFLLALRKPQTNQVNLATLLVGETLMDMAARVLGNFELWPQIASLNNLIPPYTGAMSSQGIAGWGTQLVMPSQNTSSSATGAKPSYLSNFLGVDVYVGPINGSMPQWTGDFQTISGYNNLAWALGRRLQTTLGKLIYHSNYGSRIPPEVGNVETNRAAQRITAFGKSAILSDPRVQSIISATSTLLQFGKVAFTGEIQPAGFGTRPVLLNETINQLP